MEAVELLVNRTKDHRLDMFTPANVSSIWSFISSLFFMQSKTHFITFALFVTACVEMSFHFLAIVYTHFRFYPKTPTSNEVQKETKLPGVSILKPLVGVDKHLYENLKSFFTQDYPKFELLFCVASETDAACQVVANLMTQYPDVDARLFTQAANVGINNKINNMFHAYNEAKYKIFMVSDSSLFMRKDTLLDMALTLVSESGVGMVHQSPYIKPTTIAVTSAMNPEERFTHLLQRVYFGTWHSKMYLASASLRFNCTTGMSCMMRKSVMDLAGGLGAFSGYLAEDFFFAKFYYAQGWKCLVSGQPAWQNPAILNLKSYQARMVRWCQLRSAMIPHVCLFEPFTECFPNACLMVFTAAYLFPNFIQPVSFFALHTSIWFLMDLMVLSRVHPRDEPWDFTFFEYFKVWLFRESTSLYIQLKGHLQTTIEWHGLRYKLKWGGLVKSVTPVKPKYVGNGTHFT